LLGYALTAIKARIKQHGGLIVQMATTRFCRVCIDFTKWTLDKGINHSACSECGGRFGMSNTKKIRDVIQEEFEKQTAIIQKQYWDRLSKLTKFDKEKATEEKL